MLAGDSDGGNEGPILPASLRREIKVRNQIWEPLTEAIVVALLRGDDIENRGLRLELEQSEEEELAEESEKVVTNKGVRTLAVQL